MQLEVELTNASEGGAPQDITVNLATGNGATASGSDYSYPSSVTIPQGASRVTFEVSALQDDLVEDDETLNIYVSSVDLAGYNYEQSDTGADLTIVDDDEPLMVALRLLPHQYSLEREDWYRNLIRERQAELITELPETALFERSPRILEVEVLNAPEGRAEHDITVHLATGTVTTAPASEYILPKSVTIPRGQSRVEFEVRAIDDDLLELSETLNIYVSSVDYGEKSYEQPDASVDLILYSRDRNITRIDFAGADSYSVARNKGVNYLEGATATIKVNMHGNLLPADTPPNSVQLFFLPTGNIRTVEVDEPLLVVDLTEGFKESNIVEVPFYLAENFRQEISDAVALKVIVGGREPHFNYISRTRGWADRVTDDYDLPYLLSGSRASFKILDKNEPPVVKVSVIPSSSEALSYWNDRAEEYPRPIPNAIYEKDTYLGSRELYLYVELINAPPWGAAEDITVHLATRSSSTASESDYEYYEEILSPHTSI